MSKPNDPVTLQEFGHYQQLCKTLFSSSTSAQVSILLKSDSLILAKARRRHPVAVLQWKPEQLSQNHGVFDDVIFRQLQPVPVCVRS